METSLRIIRRLMIGSILLSALVVSGCPDRKGACIDACTPKDSQIDACAKAAPRETCEKNMKDPTKIANCKAQCEQMF